MSEINAVRNAIRAERQLGQAEKAAAKVTKNVTATGKVVDISKGYNVKAPDGTIIPFRPETPLNQAKEWTRNFYRKTDEFEFLEEKGEKVALPDAPGAAWTNIENWSIMRDKADPKTYMEYSKGDTAYNIHMSFIPQSKRGKGIGAGMYRTLFEKAKKEGFKVQSDSNMSDESIAIWKRFQQLGYPIKDNSAAAVKGTSMSKTPDRSPLFEYDPAMKEAPALLKEQAGQTAADKTGEATGMLTKRQAE